MNGIECSLTDKSYISDIHNFFYALKCITNIKNNIPAGMFIFPVDMPLFIGCERHVV